MPNLSGKVVPTANVNKMLIGGLALNVTLLVLFMDRFGFLDLFGVKRPGEALLFLIICPLAFLFILSNYKIMLSPFVMLPACAGVCTFFFRHDLMVAAQSAVAALVSAFMISMGREFADKTSQMIIYFVFSFSVLGIVEFIWVFINPSLLEYSYVSYTQYSGSDQSWINHPILLFGMTTTERYVVSGRIYPRMSSFLSEPGLLATFFLIPAALAFTFKGKVSNMGWTILIFCIISGSGSVYLALSFAAVTFLVLSQKRVLFSMLFPFLFLAIFIFWVVVFGRDSLYAAVDYISLSPITPHFMHKYREIRAHVNPIIEAYKWAIDNPLSISSQEFGALGLLLHTYLYYSIIGLLILLYIMIKITSSISRAYNKATLKKTQKFGLILIYADFLTAIVFTAYGLMGIFGFIMMIMIYYRLQNMLNNVKDYRADPADAAI